MRKLAQIRARGERGREGEGGKGISTQEKATCTHAFSPTELSMIREVRRKRWH